MSKRMYWAGFALLVGGVLDFNCSSGVAYAVAGVLIMYEYADAAP